jgi:hypothetical protein
MPHGRLDRDPVLPGVARTGHHEQPPPPPPEQVADPSECSIPVEQVVERSSQAEPPVVGSSSHSA